MNLRNAEGKTAFEVAIGYRNEKIKEMLKEEYNRRQEENTTTTEEIKVIKVDKDSMIDMGNGEYLMMGGKE